MSITHGAIAPLPNTPSWRGVQLRKKEAYRLYLYLYILKV
jgi:hypothetical protein